MPGCSSRRIAARFHGRGGQLPTAAPAKLLRVLETSSVQRVGSGRDRPVDVRVLAASARDLGELVAARRFPCRPLLPPLSARGRHAALRDRVEDIPDPGPALLAELPDQSETRREHLAAAMELLTASVVAGNCGN